VMHELLLLAPSSLEQTSSSFNSFASEYCWLASRLKGTSEREMYERESCVDRSMLIMRELKHQVSRVMYRFLRRIRFFSHAMPG
jgi:hypothetical protein